MHKGSLPGSESTQNVVACLQGLPEAPKSSERTGTVGFYAKNLRFGCVLEAFKYIKPNKRHSLDVVWTNMFFLFSNFLMVLVALGV